MTPTVGVNLLWLDPGRVGGSEQSTLASVRAILAEQPSDLQLRLYVGSRLGMAHPDLAEAFPTDEWPGARGGRVARIVAESTWLRRVAKGVDLIHHAGGTAPLRSDRPYVLTLHDLQPLERRETHGRIKRTYLAATIPRSVRGARRVLVPSEFVRGRVLERFDTEPARIVTAHHGVSTLPGTDPRVLVERYRLAGPVVLCLGISYPHKNHAMLLDAFARVRREVPDALLVMPGGAGTEEAALHAQADRLGIVAAIRRPGHISDADVAGLYRLAKVVAVPSRYEGFGLPAAEAMAYGVPVVAARAAALPEVVGDAGVLVDPDDVEGWAVAIAGLLGDADGARARTAAGLARATDFSWASNARAVLGAYRAALDASD